MLYVCFRAYDERVEAGWVRVAPVGHEDTSHLARRSSLTGRRASVASVASAQSSVLRFDSGPTVSSLTLPSGVLRLAVRATAGQASIEHSPAGEVQFGTIPCNQECKRTITLTNRGSCPVTLKLCWDLPEHESSPVAADERVTGQVVDASDDEAQFGVTPSHQSARVRLYRVGTKEGRKRIWQRLKSAATDFVRHSHHARGVGRFEAPVPASKSLVQQRYDKLAGEAPRSELSGLELLAEKASAVTADMNRIVAEYKHRSHLAAVSREVIQQQHEGGRQAFANSHRTSHATP